jgi:hypothetical protein
MLGFEREETDETVALSGSSVSNGEAFFRVFAHGCGAGGRVQA